MFRSQYDSDITTWSPQGRLYQIEFAMEAVKQGSACVGVRSRTHAVLVTLKRSSGQLAAYQKKLFRIDDHMAIAIAGLTSDARVLSRYMQTEALNHKFVYESPIQVGRLVLRVADSTNPPPSNWVDLISASSLLRLESQKNTQRSGSRPYGVGLLVIGFDVNPYYSLLCSLNFLCSLCSQTHPAVNRHVSKPEHTCLRHALQAITLNTERRPSALAPNLPELTWRRNWMTLMNARRPQARNQESRIAIHSSLGGKKTGTLPELIKHGLAALGETIGSQEETGLTTENTSVAVLGENQSVEILEGAQLKPYVTLSPYLFPLSRNSY